MSNGFNVVNAPSVGKGVEKALMALNLIGAEHQRENQDMKEKMLETRIIVNVENVAAEPGISKTMMCDLEGLSNYIDEFLDGTADDSGWAYTYHQLYSPFYEKLIGELKRDENSRRAVIALGQGDINFTKDPPCLQLIMCDVHYGELCMTVVFRSNDAVKAFPMNIVAIAKLQQKVAKDLDLIPGSLCYVANNFHCYAADRDKLKSYCDLIHKYQMNGETEKRFYEWSELNEYR